MDSIYAKEIEPICAYCLYSEAAPGVPTHIYCKKRGAYMPLSHEGCSDYTYDIFKRPVHARRRKLLPRFSKEDFSL